MQLMSVKLQQSWVGPSMLGVCDFPFFSYKKLAVSVPAYTHLDYFLPWFAQWQVVHAGTNEFL